MKAAPEPQKTKHAPFDREDFASRHDRRNWHIAQARARHNGENHILTVVLAPADAKGIAPLSKENPDGTGLVEYSFLQGRLRCDALRRLMDGFVYVRAAALPEPARRALTAG